MGGRDDDGVGVGCLEDVDDQAALVNGDGDDVEAGVLDAASLAAPAGVFDGDAAGTVAAQRTPHHVQALVQAAADDDPIRVGEHAARAAEVLGEGRTQRLVSSPVAVAERVVWHVTEGSADGGVPCGARERRQVGAPGAKVVIHRLRGCERPRGGRRFDGLPGHGGTRPAAGGQVALGHELRVGIDDDAARDAEVVRQGAARRQAAARPQPARAYGVAELLLEASAQRAGRGEVEMDIHLVRRYSRRLVLPRSPIWS